LRVAFRHNTGTAHNLGRSGTPLLATISPDLSSTSGPNPPRRRSRRRRTWMVSAAASDVPRHPATPRIQALSPGRLAWKDLRGQAAAPAAKGRIA
jgi:hypothetical protein